MQGMLVAAMVPDTEVANTEAAGLESEFAERLALAHRQYPRRTTSNSTPHLDGVEGILAPIFGHKDAAEKFADRVPAPCADATEKMIPRPDHCKKMVVPLRM
jgi:hypothetical protein